MRVLLKTPLNVHTGYGNDGVGMAQALAGLGVDVQLDPAHVSTPLPQSIANLLTKRLTPPFDLLLHHADPGQLGISAPARRNSDLAVAWTMWEFTTLDNCAGRSSLRKRLRDYDTVVGYDQVSTEALDPYVTGSAATVQGGYWPERWAPMTREWQDPGEFNFCMVGALHQRKDPFLAIEAFKELKDEEPDFAAAANLHLKTVEPGLHPRLESYVPGLFLHYENWPESKLCDFYRRMHVLLAPSRGEGKNLPALEFLSTGGTVIATNWGGHRQWLSSQYAYPLDYTLAPLNQHTPNCHNARADKAHLKQLMLHVFRNRREAMAKGSNAAQIIPSMCGWLPVIDRLFTRIADLHPTKGQQLLHQLRSLAERNKSNPLQVEQYA